jgi:hypothetical protein
MMRVAILLLAVATGAAACGGGAEPVPPPAATGTPPVALLPPADLRAAIPTLDGWARGEITLQDMTSLDRSTAAMVTFTRGGEKLDLEVADTGGDPRAIESLEHMAGSDVSRTVENGYFKGTTINGLPAVESWNTVDKLGELSVLVRRRYIIHVAGSGLVDAAPMRALAEAVDTARLR